MISVFINIFISFCIFTGVVVLFAENGNNKFKKTNYILSVAGLAGLIIYGYGFSVVLNNPLQIIIRTVLAVLSMFLGKNEYSAIKDAPYMTSEWVCALFWLVHAAALYVTANAILASIGTKALKKFGQIKSRFYSNMVFMYGLNDDSLSLADEIIKDNKKRAVIFFDDKADASLAKKASNKGWLVLSDESEAESVIRKFVKSGRKSFQIYCVSKDDDENVFYAEKAGKILSEYKNTDSAITIIADMKTTDGGQFQSAFDSVQILDHPYLTARSLVHSYPPCDIMEFNACGEAQNDFHAVIVGFGKTGQAVFKNLFQNAQFPDRVFRADIFDPQFDNISGFIKKSCPSLMENFIEPQINTYSYSSGNEKFFDRIEEIKNEKPYIVVCTGDKAGNHEIAREILSLTGLPVYECSKDKIICSRPGKTEECSIFRRELLDADIADSTAMIFNQIYTDKSQLDNKEEQLKNWEKCDYFSRMSNRAAADFIPVYRKMIGKALLTGEISEDLKLRMAKQEHLRWSAFHLAFGYSTMSESEFKRRAEMYKKDSSVKIQKNTADHTHACLIPWDDLDILSEKQSEIEGKHKDYKGDDYNNIEIILEILKKEGAEV
ncbi:MAG: hypothetical protein Q4D76_12955 [Oscillospiraceae bacterium]|nr:hypothetical protein [Oscillospiraceae bacterium]